MSIVSRRAKDTKKYLIEYKDSLIMCGIFLAGLIVVMIICGIIKGQFNKTYTAAKTSVDQLDNEIYNYKSSVMQNKLGDGYVGNLANSGNTQRKLVGDQVDPGKWQQDNDAFWTYISPMFNFNSATEYNTMCQKYRKDLGSCLLTNVFLAPVDIDGQDDPEKFDDSFRCSAEKKTGFEAYPIGMDEGNGYRYIAFLKYSAKASSVYKTEGGVQTIIFTYRVSWDGKDASGNTTFKINDLAYAAAATN